MVRELADYKKAIAILNDSILELLSSDDLDTESLFIKVSERDSLVKCVIPMLDSAEVKVFAKTELQINQQIEDLCNQRKDESYANLTKFVKDAKAVRKYR